MTAIAALREGNTIYVGGDSAGVDSNYGLEVRLDPKVFVRDNFIIGFCGSFRMGQILHYEWNPPVQEKKQTTEKFIYTSFINSVRDVLKAGGYTKISENVEGHESSFVFGYRGQLYKVFGDFQVARPAESFAAAGCGEDLIRGSLYTMQKLSLDMTPHEKIRFALKAAEAGSGGVRGPFKILKLEN